MKKYIAIPAILFIISAICAFKAPESPVKYSSKEGHFSINFPGKPDESVQEDTAENGSPYKVHFASFSPNDDEVYMAGWINMNSFYPEGKEMKQMLEDSRDGATGSMKATKVNTIETNLGDNPYIEFTFESDQFIGKDRIYVINKFQYSIITIFSMKKGILPASDKFIHSFSYMK